MDSVRIRPAVRKDAEILTTISFASKRHWGYPKEYFDIWKEELTITPAYIERNRVFVAERNGKIAGYLSITEVPVDRKVGEVLLKRGLWLEHLFIRPEEMRKGIGSTLMEAAEDFCWANGIPELTWLGDPHADGFYQKCGAERIGESLSNIPGRSVTRFRMRL